MTTAHATTSPAAPHLAPSRAPFELIALALAAIALVGSLYMSMAMGLNACPLCFYQRTFIMGAFAVLLVGWLLRVRIEPGTLSVLSLPLAIAGLGVAIVHNGLVWSGTLVCPAGVFGWGSAPLQSLVAFVLLTAALLPGALRTEGLRIGPLPRLVILIALGAGLAVLSVLSAPKLGPFKPTYDEAGQRVLKVCERAKPE